MRARLRLAFNGQFAQYACAFGYGWRYYPRIILALWETRLDVLPYEP